MALSTQAIRYGWVALASLGVITGTTIYIVNNQRKQIKPEDVIPVALGADERCMALQTADGTFPVARPVFVRTWTSNVYTSNGVTEYSESVINTIGWLTDQAMMISLDTTIKALVPYYKSSETGAYLSVTGLWASLEIGDRTNQFTREPAWTNPVSTNWIVNYTSYWPSTNGVATNIIYTSDYRQVVNYAESWTATGGHIWVTSSNWASEVVTITNDATYGDYPWQIYPEDLQERYKVLYSLACASNAYMWKSNQTIYLWVQAEIPSVSISATGQTSRSSVYATGGDDDAAYWADEMIPWVITAPGSTPHALEGGYSRNQTYGRYSYSGDWRAAQWQSYATYFIGSFDTNKMHSVIVEARAVTPSYIIGFWTLPSPTETVFADSPFGAENEWVTIISNINSYATQEQSSVYGTLDKDWVDNPYTNGGSQTILKGYDTELRHTEWYGAPSHWTRNGDDLTNAAFGTNYMFYYCTNKYW